MRYWTGISLLLLVGVVMAADMKDHKDYVDRTNGTLTEKEFKDNKDKAFKNGKRDFVFGRRIITSMGTINTMQDELTSMKADIAALKAKVR